MSLLRIFLEGDHGKQTYEVPTKPMTYQHKTHVFLAAIRANWPQHMHGDRDEFYFI